MRTPEILAFSLAVARGLPTYSYLTSEVVIEYDSIPPAVRELADQITADVLRENGINLDPLQPSK